MGKLYTAAEAAEIIGITVNTLRVHCLNGHLGTKFGNVWMITEEELDEFQRTRRPPGRPPNSERANSRHTPK